MSQVIIDISVSLDGYVAGPNQSPTSRSARAGSSSTTGRSPPRRGFVDGREGSEAPGPDDEILRRQQERVGTEIMGRGKFGGGPGPWDLAWEGWWGDDPPFGHPVFVLTHHAPVPLTLSDTTLNFVTDGIESALERAKAAAGGKDVLIGGGAQACPSSTWRPVSWTRCSYTSRQSCSEAANACSTTPARRSSRSPRPFITARVTHLRYRVG